MPEIKRLPGTRIAATPAALNAVEWPDEARVMRFAPDELFVTPPLDSPELVTQHDEYAIILHDAAFSGVWLDETVALKLLERLCEWELPQERPAFAQGAVAGIPTKLWFEGEQVLVIVSSPYAAEMEERLK